MYLCYKYSLREYYVDWDFIHRFVTELLKQSGLHLEFSFYPLIYLDRYRAIKWTMVHHIIHFAVSNHSPSLYLPVPSPSMDPTG